MNARPLPPGPRRRFPGHFLLRARGGQLRLFQSLAADYGDIASMKLGNERICFINHPDFIRSVLVTDHKNFTKGLGLERARKLLGQGLLTSEVPLHMRQRRLMQPAFHQDRIRAYRAAMVKHGAALSREWRDGATVDAAQEMGRLTLGIVAETLFGSAIESEAREVGEALTSVMETFLLTMLPFADLLEKLRLPAAQRGLRARDRLNKIIYKMIDERRASREDRGDLLTMLLDTQDSESDGAGMSDEQVRDEAMTIFLAGHETTANALTWTWYLLSQHPEIETRLHAELDQVLRDKPPSFDQMRELPFTEKIVTESMRIYPPAWMIGRRAIHDYDLGGYRIPARTLVLMSQFVMHRNAQYFVDPLKFDPDRWTPEFKTRLPRFAYFPFGGGPRQCIGEGFAWMGLILLMATLAQRWKLRLVPGHPVELQPLVTLRPRHGMRMTLHRRGKSAG
jgi:cytochrome P450